MGAAAGKGGGRVAGAGEEEGARRGAPPRLQHPQPQPPIVPVPPQRRHLPPRRPARIRRRVRREPPRPLPRPRPRPPPRPPHRVARWSSRVVVSLAASASPRGRRNVSLRAFYYKAFPPFGRGRWNGTERKGAQVVMGAVCGLGWVVPYESNNWAGTFANKGHQQ